MTTDVLTQIEGNGYEATDKQLSDLASIAVAGVRAGSTYLRCLVASVQTLLRTPATGKRGRRTSPSVEASMAAFDRAHTRMYAIIVAAITVPDDPRETNRRGTFARTAASALRTWIAAGGDVLTLKLTDVTKRSLRPQRTGNRRTLTDTITRQLDRLEPEERDEALDALQALIDQYRPRITSTRALQRVKQTEARH